MLKENIERIVMFFYRTIQMNKMLHSKEEAETVLEDLKVRMKAFELSLHPEKTKIVYCKNYQRHDRHDNESFTFLSYSFQPRTVKSKPSVIMPKQVSEQPSKKYCGRNGVH